MRHIAILNLYKNAIKVSDEHGVFDINDQRIKIDETLVNQEVARLLAVDKANEYQRQRSREYPSIQEQLDMQYWDSVNGTTVWKDTIEAIKAKYPKGA